MRPQLHADRRFAKLKLCGPLAQLEEQLTLNSRPGMPMSGFRYKLELLCQLPKSHFVSRVMFGANPSQTI